MSSVSAALVKLPVLQDELAVPSGRPITAGEPSVADSEKTATTFKASSDPLQLRLFSKIASYPAGRRACATSRTSACFS